MICSLLIALPAPDYFPGRNLSPVLGRPLVAYPMMVALSSPSVSRLYVSTNAPELKELAISLGARIIEQPTEERSVHDLVRQGAESLIKSLASEQQKLDMLVVMFAHAAAVTPRAIEDGINSLRNNEQIDAAVTVSHSRQWHPRHAYRIGSQGLIEPMLPSAPWTVFDAEASASDAGAWFADSGAVILRPELLRQASWAGRPIHPIRQTGALAVDEGWQIPVVEAWIQSQQTDALFTARRTKWTQYYDSERAILSSLQLTNRSSVLDIGGDPGGLGRALQERFGVTTYTAVVRDETARKECHAINPDAKLVVGNVEALPRLEIDGFDLVSALGAADSDVFVNELLPAGFRQLMEGGALVFSVRLTAGASVQDAKVSYQDLVGSRGARERRPYVVRNIREVLQTLRALHPARILAQGYVRQPPASARTPARNICFAVFAVTRATQDEIPQPQIELHLPVEIVSAA